MYIAKYKLFNNIIIQQKILKIDILNNKKNIEIYNFCLNEIYNLDKNLYENITFRVSIFKGKMELLLFFTSINFFSYIAKIKKKISTKFLSETLNITTPINRIMFDEISSLKFSPIINRLHNSSYYIRHKQIGIDFTIGSFVEKMIDISINREWNFSYQFHLKPYSLQKKKELERYAKKYILRLEDEVYMPENLSKKLNSIANNISNIDFFIDEVLSFEKKTREFYNMIISNEFALKLSQYGFKELPLESDDIAEDLIYTGLSSMDIENITKVEQIFSSISQKSLKDFFLKGSTIALKSYIQNDILKEYDVFISYSSVNTVEAEKVCYELEEVGYKCWYAPRDILPSQAYPEQIIRGIKSAKYFVLLHSKDSTVSRYVVREVTKALSLEKIIIPILLDTSMPSENMEFILEICQWIDASQSNFDDKIGELKEVLEKLK